MAPTVQVGSSFISFKDIGEQAVLYFGGKSMTKSGFMQLERATLEALVFGDYIGYVTPHYSNDTIVHVVIQYNNKVYRYECEGVSSRVARNSAINIDNEVKDLVDLLDNTRFKVSYKEQSSGNNENSRITEIRKQFKRREEVRDQIARLELLTIALKGEVGECIIHPSGRIEILASYNYKENRELAYLRDSGTKIVADIELPQSHRRMSVGIDINADSIRKLIPELKDIIDFYCKRYNHPNIGQEEFNKLAEEIIPESKQSSTSKIRISTGIRVGYSCDTTWDERVTQPIDIIACISNRDILKIIEKNSTDNIAISDLDRLVEEYKDICETIKKIETDIRGRFEKAMKTKIFVGQNIK